MSDVVLKPNISKKTAIISLIMIIIVGIVSNYSTVYPYT